MKGTPHTRSGNIINVDDGETLLIHASTTHLVEAIRVIGEKLRDRTTTKDLILFGTGKVKKYPTKFVAEYLIFPGMALTYSREMEKGSAMVGIGAKKPRSDAGRSKNGRTKT